MPQVLELTNGTRTVNLLGTAAYLREDGWAPAVAQRRRSELGNQGDYENVVEEMTINLYGTAGLAALRDLNLLLDEGRRFWDGDISAVPVRLRVQPDNSTLGVVLESLVYGSEDGGPVQLPRSFHDLLKTNEVDEVTLRFIRAPLWINPTAETASSTAANTQELHTITFGSNHPTNSPLSLSITTNANTGNSPSFTGFIAAPAATSFPPIINAESLQPGSSSNYTTVANATARNGNHLRWWTDSTLTTNDAASTEATFITNTRRIHAFMVARNNWGFIGTTLQAAREPIRLTLEFRNNNLAVSSIYRLTTIVDIEDSINLIYLGSIALPLGTNRMRLLLGKVSGSTKRAGLDIDTIILVNEANGSPDVVRLVNQGSSIGALSSNVTLVTVLNDPLAVLQVQPEPQGGQAAGNSPFGGIVTQGQIDGDLYLQSRGSTYVVFPVAVGPGNVWRFDQFNSTTVTVSARRHRGYLTLE